VRQLPAISGSDRGGDIPLRLTYEPRFNIAYILFRQESTEVQSVKFSDELIVDMTPDGTIRGIELLNANEPVAA